jgi:hypothetical protein
MVPLLESAPNPLLSASIDKPLGATQREERLGEVGKDGSVS